MDHKKESASGLVSNLWRNWVRLSPDRRSDIAASLGTIGHVLSIAANVQEFANKFESQTAVDENREDLPSDDDDIIDVEFEELVDEDG